MLGKPCPIPSKPGVYAWYFDELPPGVPDEDCHKTIGHTLLYVGISPKAPPSNGGIASRQNLRQRIRYHFRGNASGSTLRLTLGSLLSGQLGIGLRRVGSGLTRTFTNPGEAALDRWMGEHARVVWLEAERPWELEGQLIGSLSLPLNIAGNARHSYWPMLLAAVKIRA